MKILSIIFVSFMGLLFVIGGSVWAVDITKTSKSEAPGQMMQKMDPQKMIQMHEKMAEIHKKAAECIKSGKTPQICHQTMMKNCPMKDKSGNCSIMGVIGDNRTMRQGMGYSDPRRPKVNPEPTAKERDDDRNGN